MEDKTKYFILIIGILGIVVVSMFFQSSYGSALEKYNYISILQLQNSSSGNSSGLINSTQKPYLYILNKKLIANISAWPVGNGTFDPSKYYNRTQAQTNFANKTLVGTNNTKFTNKLNSLNSTKGTTGTCGGQYVQAIGTTSLTCGAPSFSESDPVYLAGIVNYFTKIAYWSNATNSFPRTPLMNNAINGNITTLSNTLKGLITGNYTSLVSLMNTRINGNFTSLNNRIVSNNTKLNGKTANINNTLNNLIRPQQTPTFNDTYATFLQEYDESYLYNPLFQGTTVSGLTKRNSQGTLTTGLDYDSVRISVKSTAGSTGGSFPFSLTNITWYQATAQFYKLNNSVYKTGFYSYELTGKINITLISGIFDSNVSTATPPISLSMRDGCALWFNKTYSNFLGFKTCNAGSCRIQLSNINFISSTNSMTTYYTYELRSNNNSCYNILTSSNSTNNLRYTYNFTTNIFQSRVTQVGLWFRGLDTTGNSINLDYIYYSTKRVRSRR